MEVYRYLKSQKEPTAVALGFFDGVHLGHQKILLRAVKEAERGLKSCVLTFTQNPRSIVENCGVKLIMSEQEKISRFENIGLDMAYILDFNSIKNLSPEEFVKDILFSVLHAKVAVCGFNYHFGNGGRADSNELTRLCEGVGISVCVVPPALYRGAPISSTRIRNALIAGQTEVAQDMLFNKKQL